MARELSTPDSLAYQFFPLSGSSINFTVKCTNDAHIALSLDQNDAPPFYEVFIGGWGNSHSAIQKNKEKPEKVKVETPSIVNGDEYRGFWISCVGGTINVGRQGEESPFISWSDPDPFVPTYYGLSTAWGSTGEWKVDAPLSGPFTPGRGTWVPASGGAIPPDAVSAGFDKEEELFVGRAKHESGALLPGKVVASHGVCYVPWGGGEHGIADYEVLTGCQVEWLPSEEGQVPAGALPAGETEDGEPLYVGRADCEGSVSVGKIQSTHAACYIPFNGEEVAYDQYEVLVTK